MNSIDTTLRILWLSDIHYKSQYEQKNAVLKNYLEGFHSKCEQIDAESEIDYILLSGDIAQSGTAEDYALFNNDILLPLQKLLPHASLLVIPGNHDVYRNGGNFLNDFIQSLDERAIFFGNRYKDFEKVFANYTDAFKGNKAICTDCSPNYKSTLLQGYLVDHKKKTIFILFNSSWYSFDKLFLEEYLRHHGIKGKDAEPECKAVYQDIKKILKRVRIRIGHFIGKNKATQEEPKPKNIVKDIQRIANEYGNQIIGLDSYKEFKELQDKLDYYSDYMVITTMHHPANWLGWAERISNVDNKFDLIKKKTDLLLTGHEHVPKSHASEFLNEKKLLHIQAGCFMESQKPEEFKVKDNWFSVLDININKRAVVNEKYTYNSNTWEIDKDYLAPKKLNKKYYTKLISKRRISITESAAKFLNQGTLLEKFVGKKLDKSGSFFIDGNKMYKLIEKFDDLTPEIVLEALNNHLNIEFVYLVFVDLYYEEKEEYSSGRDKLLVLQDIKLKIDFQFNKFRHDFFSNLTLENAAKFENLKIASIIVPYWEYESIVN